MPRNYARRARPALKAAEPIQTERPELRPEPRAAMRDDPRARAEARAAEIMGRVDDMAEGQDEFHIPGEMVPDGWSYEWKRNTVLGAEDPSYQVALAQTGWEAVPAGRHPELMPTNWRGNHIERKGMVLMERPAEITKRVQNLEKRKASDQVRGREEQLNMAPQGQFERSHQGESLAKVRKSYESVPIPE